MKVLPTVEKLVPYSPGKPIEETQREYGLSKVIKLASNENPLGASPKVLNALAGALDQIKYYPDAGTVNIKKRASEFYNLSQDQILFGNGSNELIDLLVKTFCHNQDRILISEYSFIAYKISAKASGVAFDEVPTQNFAIDLDCIFENLNSLHRLVFIPNPNNPTGHYLMPEKVLDFLDKTKSFKDLLVVFDEAYFEYVDPDLRLDLIQQLNQFSHLVVLRTYAKAYGLAGLRIGALFGSKEIVNYLNRVRQPFNVNTLAQVALYEAFGDMEHIAKSYEENLKGRSQVMEALGQMNLEYVPSQSNFILFDSQRDSGEVYEKLLEQGVILRPLKPYGLNSHLRMSIGTIEDNREALDKLSQVLKNVPVLKG